MGSAQAAYEIAIDFTGSGKFDGANDDVTSRALNASWQLGNSNPLDNMARAAAARVTLDNEDRKLSPSVAGNYGSMKGSLLRIRMVLGDDNAASPVNSPSPGSEGIGDCCSAWAFGGGSEYMDIPATFDSLFPAAAGSLSLWARADNAAVWSDATVRYAALFYVDANNQLYVRRSATNNQVDVAYIAGGVSKSISLTVGPSTDWFHILVTWDTVADEFKVYLDGTQTGGTLAGLGVWAGSPATNRIGGTGAADAWYGTLAHVCLWDVVRDATEAADFTYWQARQRDYVLSLGADDVVAYWQLCDAAQATDAEDTASRQTMFIGWVDTVKPLPNEYSPDRWTQISSQGYFVRLMDEMAFAPAQIDKTASEIIAALLTGITLYPPGFTGWLLGVSGYSELGVTTFLAASGAGAYACIQPSTTVFPYAGDNWQEGTSLYSALRSVVDSEQGWLSETRSGRIKFTNRQFWWTSLPMAYAWEFLKTDTTSADYEFGRWIFNQVKVDFNPRSETGSSTLATLGSSVLVPAGEAVSVDLQYRSTTDGSKLGGRAITNPPTFSANTLPDGSGTDVTASFSADAEEGGTFARVTFENLGAVNAYVTACTISGTAITDYETMGVIAEDSSSVGLYGRYPLSIGLPLVSDWDYASNLAYWYVTNFAAAGDDLDGIGYQANDRTELLRRALWLTLGDRLKASEYQTGYDKEVFIVGEQHEVDTECNHKVTYVLRSSIGLYWVLGVTGFSEIGVSTYLGF